jgi:hypothetical protein
MTNIHVPVHDHHTCHSCRRFNSTGLFTLTVTSEGTTLGRPYGPIGVLPPPPADGELAPQLNLDPGYCEHGEVTCSEHGVQDGCACLCYEGFTTDWTVVVGGLAAAAAWCNCVLGLMCCHSCSEAGRLLLLSIAASRGKLSAVHMAAAG